MTRANHYLFISVTVSSTLLDYHAWPESGLEEKISPSALFLCCRPGAVLYLSLCLQLHSYQVVRYILMTLYVYVKLLGAYSIYVRVIGVSCKGVMRAPYRCAVLP